MARPPKPSAQAAADGDTRKLGRRKLQARIDADPRTQRGLPECPDHLQGLARKAWDDWSQQLAIMDLDHMPDAVALEGACSNYAIAVEADDAIRKHGLVNEQPVMDKTGEVVGVILKPRPEVAMSANAWRVVKQFVSEFGFTPVSRARIAIHKQPTRKGPTLAEILQQPEDTPGSRAVQ